MPQIKIKHVVSFSSEDKVHKAENLIKPETYRQWKCATPGEKNATVVLQFEKATQISSIDIGNASSAFVEVLVGRSSDTTRDYQVLLVASSFMSPIESRCETHSNRVRMFGPEKLSQNTKEEKWDCVQVVCTQPFNKNITYGLSFIIFHSPSDKIEEYSKSSEAEAATMRIGGFRLRKEEDDDSLLSTGSWFEKQKTQVSESPSNSLLNKAEPSYASMVLASSACNINEMSLQNNSQKRKEVDKTRDSDEPPVKKASTATLNKDHIIYKDVLRDTPENRKTFDTSGDLEKNISNQKPLESKKAPATTLFSTPKAKKNAPVMNSPETPKASTSFLNNSNNKMNLRERVPFEKIMDKVVFVLSGFVNPLRGVIRDKALKMGAKYKGDWDNSCTHLVCAFINTPKYQQVKKLKGKIVTKEWILDCYKMKKHIPWTKYILANDSSEESDSSEEPPDYSAEESDISEEEFDDSEYSDEEYTDKKKRKRNKQSKKVNNKSVDSKKKIQINSESNKNNLRTLRESDQPDTPKENILGLSVRKNNSSISVNRDETSTSVQRNLSSSSTSPPPTKDESETEDEEALQDYLADTDADGDSGGDTEDEIRKVEKKLQRNSGSPSKRARISEENSEYSEKPDVTDLPLPDLPNLFKQKHFFLFGYFSSSKQHDLHRYIIAYNGVIEDYMNNKVKYVITEAKWDKEFENALNENEDLVFVKPSWIYKCHDAGKLVPYQPYIVIPDAQSD